MNSFYSEQELQLIGFKKYGKNVLISKKTSIYGANKIIIGNNVRIDDFCILSGNIEFEGYTHIAAYSSLFSGKYKIVFEKFSGLSSRCVVYAESDDYSGSGLTNPTIPEKYRRNRGGDVIFKQHAIIGTGSVILPGVIIGEGAAIGAMSLVTRNVPEWSICVGVPLRKLSDRSKKMLEFTEFLDRAKNE